MNGSLETVDGRPVLRVERRLKHSPEKVWRAITEPAHLSHWFPARMAMAPHVGAKITFEFGEGDWPAQEGVILELNPPKVFAFSWGEDVLRWEIQPDGDGSVLTLRHAIVDRPGAASFAAGWNVCVDALDKHLAEEPFQGPAEFDAEHEELIRRFGLDQGTATDTADGWQVRFERQLVRPIDTAWAVLTGGETPVVGGPAPSGATIAAFPAGQITTIIKPTIIGYPWRGGTVEWEVKDGTGHGARLILTQTGPATEVEARAVALAAWRERIEEIAAQIAAQVRGMPG